jgi:SNF2 family DNA or RNA helicase
VAYTREDVVDGKVRYKVVVRLSGELFRLKRKAVRLHGRTSPQGKTGRYVRGASFVRTEEVRCIKLSSTAGLFVTNDYTPTHNCEFQRIIDPFFLRRTIKDVEDELPELVVSKKWGYLLPAQKTVYEQLRKGTVTLLSQGKRHEAKQNIHSMQLLVNSTAALGVQEDISWKLDWLMEQLHKDASGMGGSMSEDKVVVFAQHKATIRVITQRLEREGIGYVTMTGDYSKEDRQRFKKQFWEDPHCQVLIGTTAIEVSANLHCARFLVAFDSLPNPQRVEQLVGRIRRTGSEHKTVVFVMLLTYDTFEEKLYTRLERRQATVDKVFVETSDIFDSLSDMELAQLFSD